MHVRKLSVLVLVPVCLLSLLVLRGDDEVEEARPAVTSVPDIDAVIQHVEENLSEDVRLRGLNGDFAASGVYGDFDVVLQNSRDHPDPVAVANLTRIHMGERSTKRNKMTAPSMAVMSDKPSIVVLWTSDTFERRNL